MSFPRSEVRTQNRKSGNWDFRFHFIHFMSFSNSEQLGNRKLELASITTTFLSSDCRFRKSGIEKSENRRSEIRLFLPQPQLYALFDSPKPDFSSKFSSFKRSWSDDSCWSRGPIQRRSIIQIITRPLLISDHIKSILWCTSVVQPHLTVVVSPNFHQGHLEKVAILGNQDYLNDHGNSCPFRTLNFEQLGNRKLEPLDSHNHFMFFSKLQTACKSEVQSIKRA